MKAGYDAAAPMAQNEAAELDAARGRVQELEAQAVQVAAEHEAALSIVQDEAGEEKESAAADLEAAQERVQELETQAVQMAAEHEDEDEHS